MFSIIFSIPPYIWSGIFKLLQVLGVGLILGWFASRYQKRKEVEIKIKGNLLQKRLTTLEKVNHLNSEIYHTIAPPIPIQPDYISLLNKFDFPIYELEYSKFFDNETAFDDYYSKLGQLIIDEHIFFDYDIDRHLSEYQNYLTEIKLLLDAFCDVEHNENTDKINNAYKCFGLLFQHDLRRFYAIIDLSIAKQIRKISLAYKDQYFKRIYNNIHYKLSLLSEKHLKEQNKKGKISRKIYYNYLYSHYGNSILLQNVEYAIVLLMYIHYSDKYTIQQFEDLPEEKKSELIKTFDVQFRMNYHA